MEHTCCRTLQMSLRHLTTPHLQPSRHPHTLPPPHRIQQDNDHLWIQARETFPTSAHLTLQRLSHILHYLADLREDA